MKHPSIRELFHYWDERRGGRAMPERADIEPAAIRRVLADTFILSFEPAAGHPFRIAGTRVCALFGRELKGESFLRLFSHRARSDMGALLAIVAEEAVGVVGSASASRAEGCDRHLELLLLPLGHEGQGTARLLGALAPGDSLQWPRERGLAALTLGSYRFLVADAVISPPAQVVVEKRGRPNLVVYEGGQR